MVFAHTLGIVAEAWPVLLAVADDVQLWMGQTATYMVAPLLRYQPRHEQTEAFGQASGSLESRELFKQVLLALYTIGIYRYY